MLQSDDVFKKYQLDLEIRNLFFLKKDPLLSMQETDLIEFIMLLKGFLRSYHLDDKGKIHTFMFAPEDWIIGDVESIALGNQNSLYIDCLEDSEVIVSQEINPDSNPTILEEKNNKLLRRVGMLQQRVIMLMSYTARERYEFFLKTYPTLPNRVSQMIASYLGITPEALSKIRREMVSN